MTIDKEKLKALAELATQGDWERDGFQVCPVADQNASLGRFGKSADAAYVAAAQPSVVLALLAEIEQLRESHEQVCTNYNRVSFTSEQRGKHIDQLKAENEALRSAALAVREFIMHEAEVRGLLDDKGQVSHRHPRRQSAIASIDAAMAKEASHG